MRTSCHFHFKETIPKLTSWKENGSSEPCNMKRAQQACWDFMLLVDFCTAAKFEFFHTNIFWAVLAKKNKKNNWILLRANVIISCYLFAEIEIEIKVKITPISHWCSQPQVKPMWGCKIQQRFASVAFKISKDAIIWTWKTQTSICSFFLLLRHLACSLFIKVQLNTSYITRASVLTV